MNLACLKDAVNANAVSFINFFQMAFWKPSQNKFYIPPLPITRAISTDEFVQRTNIFYHASSERLLIVGHPYFAIEGINEEGTEDPPKIPKVSPYQYRVFRVRLPDPNEFVFPDKSAYNPETERMVWACRGMEIGRGGPLGIGLVGSPLFNKKSDMENPADVFDKKSDQDHRKNVAFDGKQTQMFIVGNEPAYGEYWTVAPKCNPDGADWKEGDCPPIQLKDKRIEDGQMGDYGFGNIDAKALQANNADMPLDAIKEITVYPDYHRMTHELYGNQLWFYARREQLYARHLFNRQGATNEEIPDGLIYFAHEDNRVEGAPTQRSELPEYTYTAAPSGSLVSTDTQLFNRPYWLTRAQGLNNGICWNNEMFVTVMDTTRGTNFNISVNTSQTPGDTGIKWEEQFEYLRHVEEYELGFIFQLCRIKLDAEILAYLNHMDPRIIEGWNLDITTPPNDNLHEVYRWIESYATKCPDKADKPKDTDPYAKLKFWNVDLRERFSEQLDQYSLGRRFLFQAGLTNNTIGNQVITKPIRTVRVKRKRSIKATTSKRKR